MYMGQVQNLSGHCRQPQASADIPLILPLWCNEGGAATGLESPEPSIPYLFIVSVQTETQWRSKM